MSNESSPDNARLNADDLYREEVYTDRQVGSIRVLNPVTVEGADDDKRKSVFIGQASLYTPAGALPLNFDLNADSLADAIEKFPQAASRAVEETMQQLQEMRRESASSLVLPGQDGGKAPGGGFQLP